MPFGSVILCAILTLGVIAVTGVLIYFDSRDGDTRRIALYILFGFIFIAAIWGRTTWYFSNTTSDTHALHDQQSELSNDCEQTITVGSFFCYR